MGFFFGLTKLWGVLFFRGPFVWSRVLVWDRAHLHKFMMDLPLFCFSSHKGHLEASALWLIESYRSQSSSGTVPSLMRAVGRIFGLTWGLSSFLLLWSFRWKFWWLLKCRVSYISACFRGLKKARIPNYRIKNLV